MLMPIAEPVIDYTFPRKPVMASLEHERCSQVSNIIFNEHFLNVIDDVEHPYVSEVHLQYQDITFSQLVNQNQTLIKSVSVKDSSQESEQANVTG
ncbi:hypothetical protein CVS40_11278 [Lucilia cuprina]|nr:hypothetical protein CVS40_11278 [Lucilia cuprina]